MKGQCLMPESVPNTFYPRFVEDISTWIPLNTTSLPNVLSEYPCSTEECKGQLAEVLGDSGFICNEVLIAEPFLKAYHGADIAFAFNNVPATYGNYTLEEITLSNLMANRWAQFIKGNFTDLTQFSSTTEYSRINLTTPATTPYP